MTGSTDTLPERQLKQPLPRVEEGGSGEEGVSQKSKAPMLLKPAEMRKAYRVKVAHRLSARPSPET